MESRISLLYTFFIGNYALRRSLTIIIFPINVGRIVKIRPFRRMVISDFRRYYNLYLLAISLSVIVVFQRRFDEDTSVCGGSYRIWRRRQDLGFYK